MRLKRALLGTVERAITQTCEATDWCAEPIAHPRTKRCKLHQQEYRIAAAHFRVLKHRKQKDESEREAFIAERLTQSADILTHLNGEQRRALVNIVHTSTQQRARLLKHVATLEELAARLSKAGHYRTADAVLEATRDMERYLNWRRKTDDSLSKIAADPDLTV